MEKPTKGCHRPIKQLTRDGEFIQEFESIKDAARQLGLKERNVAKVAMGKRHQTGGYKFQFVYEKSYEIDFIEGEEWRKCVDHDRYSVSNIGRVRNDISQRLIKCTDAHGYHKVALYPNGTNKVYVHNLVATAFLPNSENKPQINHINAVRNDNRVDNLEWCTSSENLYHSHRVGRFPVVNKLWRAVDCLTLDDEYVTTYPSISKAAKAVNVSVSLIGHVVTGRRNYNVAAGYKWRCAQ